MFPFCQRKVANLIFTPILDFIHEITTERGRCQAMPVAVVYIQAFWGVFQDAECSWSFTGGLFLRGILSTLTHDQTGTGTRRIPPAAWKTALVNMVIGPQGHGNYVVKTYR